MPGKGHDRAEMPRCLSQSRNLSFNPKAVLDKIPLKDIEKGRLTEPSDGDLANLLATPGADTAFTSKQKQKAPAPVDTPKNTAAVQSHVSLSLMSLIPLQFRVFPLTTVASI